MRRRERGAGGVDRRPELALEAAVVPQPGQGVALGADLDLAVRLRVAEGDRGLGREELRELELVLAEVGLGLAHPADVEGAQDLAFDEERDDDQQFVLRRRTRDQDGPRVGQRVVGEDGLLAVDGPAGDAGFQRGLVAEDDLGEPVPGDDGTADAPLRVDPVDRQRVVRDHGLQRVGDQLQDARRIEGREELLVDGEEAPLTGDLVLELGLLVAELLETFGVDQRLRGVAGEDRRGSSARRVRSGAGRAVRRR